MAKPYRLKSSSNQDLRESDSILFSLEIRLVSSRDQNDWDARHQGKARRPAWLMEVEKGIRLYYDFRVCGLCPEGRSQGSYGLAGQD